MLNNLPPVTKNLLILNVLFFLASNILESKGINISQLLGAHYFNSLLFKPFQIITHMFMHSLTDYFHIIFNMLLLVMFGGHLERIWGPKKYFVFYFLCGLGAIALYNTIGVWQIVELKELLIMDGYDLLSLNNKIYNENYDLISINSNKSNQLLNEYILKTNSTIVGASGAIFGLLSGFALLFPNTKLMLLFPPIPIKAKYLIGGYLILETYNSFFNTNDQIAHLAHVGGAIVGIIIVIIWRKTDRQNFY